MTLDLSKPLQFGACDNTGAAFQIHDGKRQIAIVEVAEFDGDPETDGVLCQPDYADIPTGEAYAKLFTAAPDMLKALKKALPVLRDAIASGLYPRDDLTDRLVHDLVQAAIEKAGAP